MAFDVNARHLPKGRRFFAEALEIDGRLEALGVNSGDVIICHILNRTHHDCLVDVYVGGTATVLSGYGYGNFLEYAGRLDGSDFICNEVRDKAKKVHNWED